MPYSEKEADAAFLRLVFNEAVQEYANVFSGRSGKLPPNWKPSIEDQLTMEIWNRMYESIRDDYGGMTMLTEIQYLRDRIEQLEAENAQLHGPLAPMPEYVLIRG